MNKLNLPTESAAYHKAISIMLEDGTHDHLDAYDWFNNGDYQFDEAIHLTNDLITEYGYDLLDDRIYDELSEFFFPIAFDALTDTIDEREELIKEGA